MLEQMQDEQEIIARVAALDIGKAELVCCVRVPDPGGAVEDGAPSVDGLVGIASTGARVRPFQITFIGCC